MDMGTSTMADMSGMSMASTATGTAAMASSTSSVSGMSMGGSSCKINMLWNWYTIDACFLSTSWHITSKGMFAGTCIGVILLVMTLELLRRAGKEYDRYLFSQYRRSLPTPPSCASSSSQTAATAAKEPTSTSNLVATTAAARFRPNVWQQAIRAGLHMLQFAVAYIVMLLAMYYNGYVIICIFIGAYLGYFLFGWETLSAGGKGDGRLEEEVTVCCG